MQQPRGLAAAAAASLLLLLLLACPAHSRCPYATSSQNELLPSSHHRSLTVADAQRHEIMAAKAAEIDYHAVKADIIALLTDSQPFWPADFGNYGGLFIRLAWHSAGTYRRWDGRGGIEGGRQRFEPELSWRDNTNLDKPKLLLKSIKEKYGDGLSWGDLIMLAGTAAIEGMGGPVLGFCAGRIDDLDGSASLELGPTAEQEAISPCLDPSNCTSPLGPTEIGLIYVNPEGPGGHPDPTKSVPQIRDSFGRMGMNDSETVALIGGGHSFGKMHGACPSGPGPSPAEDPSNPWPGTCGEGPLKGKGNNTFTAGIEGTWVDNPTVWTNDYFYNLVEFEWKVGKGPGNHFQWKPTARPGNPEPGDIVMMTTDVALVHDPVYSALVEEFLDIGKINEAFSHAWYKLMTADMGPRSRCINADAPPAQPFQLPLPDTPKHLADFTRVKSAIRRYLYQPSPVLPGDDDAGSPYYGALFATLAWQCASTFRATDYKGGCNGARIRFHPHSDWPANKGLDKVLELLGHVRADFPESDGALSWADLIVLAGTTAVEQAAGGSKLKFKFCGGRTDASDAQGTEFLAPRQYPNPIIAAVDNAKVMGLTPEEFVALQGGLRSPSHQKAIGYSGSWTTASPSELSNKFFTTLLGETWTPSTSASGLPEYKAQGKDLYLTEQDYALKGVPAFLHAAKAFAADKDLFLSTYKAAWTKMMNADRFKGPAGNVCAN